MVRCTAIAVGTLLLTSQAGAHAGPDVVASDAGSRSPVQNLQSETVLNHARVLPYPVAQVWPSTVRYLRVDRHYTIQDRDKEAGYVLFDFPLGQHPDQPASLGRGSVELVSTTDASGREASKIKVATNRGPVHLPHAIVDGIAAKLQQEVGPPAPPPPKDPPSDEAPDDDPPKDGSDPPLLPPAQDPDDFGREPPSSVGDRASVKPGQCPSSTCVAIP